MVLEDSSDSSQSPLKLVDPIEVEDSLELSEGMGEVLQDPVPPNKEDSMEYSALFLPVVTSPKHLSPLVLEHVYQDPTILPLPTDVVVAPADTDAAHSTNDAPVVTAIATATVEPEQNIVATLLIGLSTSMDSLHSHMSESMVSLPSFLDGLIEYRLSLQSSTP